MTMLHCTASISKILYPFPNKQSIIILLVNIYCRQDHLLLAPKIPYSLSYLPYIIPWIVNVMDFTPVSNLSTQI